MKHMIRTRLLKDHVVGCSALLHFQTGFWSTPWWLPVTTEARDSIGRRGGGRRWLRAECNSTHCDGVLLVAEDDLLLAVHASRDEKPLWPAKESP